MVGGDTLLTDNFKECCFQERQLIEAIKNNVKPLMNHTDLFIQIEANTAGESERANYSIASNNYLFSGEAY